MTTKRSLIVMLYVHTAVSSVQG